MRLNLSPNEPLTAFARANGIEQRGQISGTRLYRFRDSRGRLLYIGVTCCIPERWIAHRRTGAWWPLVATVELSEPYRHKANAEDAERMAIRAERPIFNRRSRQDHCPTHAQLTEHSVNPPPLAHWGNGMEGNGRGMEGMGEEHLAKSFSSLLFRTARDTTGHEDD